MCRAPPHPHPSVEYLENTEKHQGQNKSHLLFHHSEIITH